MIAFMTLLICFGVWCVILFASARGAYLNGDYFEFVLFSALGVMLTLWCIDSILISISDPKYYWSIQ